MRAQRRILVVDDDDAYRGTVRRYLLQDTAYSNVVLMAQTGEEGLSLFQKEPAGAVLLDHNLPGLSGLDALRALRATSGAPVILLTGGGDSDTAREALSLGAQD